MQKVHVKISVMESVLSNVSGYKLHICVYVCVCLFLFTVKASPD